ncbi:hypothetical protein ACJX0J_042034, partial [Zea mays]
AESPGSPTASAPTRAEEDSVAGAAPARSDGSTHDAAAVAQKGADKPSSAVAESSKRRKEPEQQQPAAPWAKLLSQCSQMVVIDEIDSFLFRPHVGLRAKYQAV